MAKPDYAIIFPGQGAQEVGMGLDFRNGWNVAQEAFDEVDEALGFKLSRIILEGPEDELIKTAVTQPAILVTSIAILRAVEREFGCRAEPRYFAGHSLGEYTALVACGVLSLGDAARLVHKRGALMQDAVPVGAGAMSAVLGLEMEELAAICNEAARDEVCSPANENSPGQIVISGNADAVARAGELAKSRGASKVIPLKVSAPFHCALMRPVADKLREEFGNCAWREPSVPIIANVDAKPKTEVGQIQEALYHQTFMPVLWAQGVRAMLSEGVGRFCEIGPGNVLSGLIKRIAKGNTALSINKASNMPDAVEFLRGAAE
ncbi:MAG: ACP S-malonyltransferase [Synergistaceae bacterium]|nr:ACP S-malonyltransferase [Synergistaceae bacterium]